MFLLAFCCFAADSTAPALPAKGSQSVIATVSPSHLQRPSSGCPRCPSTAGSTHVGLTKITSPAVYTTFPCTLPTEMQRCLIVGLFVRQDTISRTVLPLLWQHQHQWDFDHDVTVLSFQVTSKMFSIQTCTTKKFITTGNEKSFRDVQNRHILLSGSHWERSVFHCLLFNPAFSWGHPAGVEYRYFAIRGHLLYD